jgi:hypothetical protein
MSVGSPSARTRFLCSSRPCSVALVALALACFGGQADNGDGRGGDAPSPPVDATAGGSEPNPSVEPSDTETTPGPPSGGPLDSCTSTTWTHPSEPKREATCVQHWDETQLEPVLRYVCSCDVGVCPIYVPDGQDPNGPPVRLNDCVVDGVASGCGDSLQAACDARAGRHGYCEREYYGLAPTRPEQSPPASATLVCFEQSDGTHACQCPHAPDLVPTNETDCDRALLTACQTPCDSTAGRCTPSGAGYDCVCTAGFERVTVELGLCDYALFHACEPQCSNEMGACYWDPSGGPTITCRCNDDVQPQTLERDPNVTGDECRTPLVDTCGGSSEGPTAWP